MQISEVLQIKGEMPIPSVDGTIRQVDRFCPGISKYDGNPYSFQDVFLTENGHDLKCIFSTRPELPPQWIGHRVTLSAQNGRGLIAKWRNKPKAAGVGQELVLVVMDAAIMAETSAQPSAPVQTMQQPAPQPQQFQQAPAPMPMQQAPMPGSQPMPAMPVNSPQMAPRAIAQPPPPQSIPLPPQQAVCECWLEYERVGNCYALALEQGEIQRDAYNARHPKTPMTDAQFQGMVSNFAIYGTDRRLPSKMTVGDISQYMANLGKCQDIVGGKCDVEQEPNQ